MYAYMTLYACRALADPRGGSVFLFLNRARHSSTDPSLPAYSRGTGFIWG
jgi:hypothetical protein